jgi:hypothetical protein
MSYLDPSSKNIRLQPVDIAAKELTSSSSGRLIIAGFAQKPGTKPALLMALTSLSLRPYDKTIIPSM